MADTAECLANDVIAKHDISRQRKDDASCPLQDHAEHKQNSTGNDPAEHQSGFLFLSVFVIDGSLFFLIHPFQGLVSAQQRTDFLLNPGRILRRRAKAQRRCHAKINRTILDAGNFSNLIAQT